MKSACHGLFAYGWYESLIWFFPYPPTAYVTLVMWRHALFAFTLNLQLIARNEHKALWSDRFLYFKSIFISDFVIISSQCAHRTCSLSLHEKCKIYTETGEVYQNAIYNSRRYSSRHTNSCAETNFLWMFLRSPSWYSENLLSVEYTKLPKRLWYLRCVVLRKAKGEMNITKVVGFNCRPSG